MNSPEPSEYTAFECGHSRRAAVCVQQAEVKIVPQAEANALRAHVEAAREQCAAAERRVGESQKLLHVMRAEAQSWARERETLAERVRTQVRVRAPLC